MKEKIKTLCKDAPDAGAEATPEFQKEIEGYLGELIESNPIKKTATEGGEKGKLDGTWKLVYTNRSGISTGRLGPFYERPYQEIYFKKGYVLNIVEYGPVKLLINSKLTVLDDVRIEIQFDYQALYVFGKQILKVNVNDVRKGKWNILYIDDDFRIMTTIGSRPGSIEKLYAFEKV